MSGLIVPEAGRRHVRPALFLRIATDPVARMWTGIGGLVLPADGVEVAGGRYLGAGWLRNIPAMDALINGAAESITFTLSGVDEETTALLDAVGDVRGVRANVGLMFMGPGYVRQPVKWWRRYRVDMVSSRETAIPIPSSGQAGVEHSISLTIGSARTSRRAFQPSTWTHVEQRRLQPGDNGCRMVSRLTGDATRSWPPKA